MISDKQRARYRAVNRAANRANRTNSADYVWLSQLARDYRPACR